MSGNIYHNKSLKNLSFLVTGGAGFIGSNLVGYLIKNGAKKVRILDDLSTGYYQNIKEFEKDPAFEFIEGDIRNLDDCLKGCKEIDYVSHQAALGSVPRSINDPLTTNSVNITGFLNVLVAMRNEKVKRLVYAASSSTYGDSKSLPKVEDTIGKPLSPYAVTKYVNELYANVFGNLYGIETIGLRYFNVFGPKQNPNGAYAAAIPLFINSIIENKSCSINGDGEQTRDFTFVDNAVQANIKAFFSKTPGVTNQVYNIAFGQRTSLNNLWLSLNTISGKSIQPTYNDPRIGDVRDSLADISKAASALGYDPKIDIMKGLEITYQWYRNILHKDI